MVKSYGLKQLNSGKIQTISTSLVLRITIAMFPHGAVPITNACQESSAKTDRKRSMMCVIVNSSVSLAAAIRLPKNARPL